MFVSSHVNHKDCRLTVINLNAICIQQFESQFLNRDLLPMAEKHWVCLLRGFNGDPGRDCGYVGTSRCLAYFIHGSLMAWSPLC